jgi:hypothetical protein
MAIGRKFNVSMFFDKPAVTKSVDRARITRLSKFGAFVRTRARSSIRKRKKVSAAGTPPSSRTGVLKRFIFFSYERQNDSVIIGPAKTNQIFFNHDGEPVNGTVPEILEKGGSITIREVQYPNGKWWRDDLRIRRTDHFLANAPRRMRTIQIDARPYMGPAFEAELPKAPGLWANSVK